MGIHHQPPESPATKPSQEPGIGGSDFDSGEEMEMTGAASPELPVSEVRDVSVEYSSIIERRATEDWPTPGLAIGEAVVATGEGKEERFPDAAERFEAGESSEVAAPVLLKHRTAWWNCCGLLDLFRGLGR